MMTKEEYKKTLVRMFDSMRDDTHKGEPNCRGLCCGDCPLSDVGCGTIAQYADVVEFVEEWGKEHPVETNGSIYLKNFHNAKVLGHTNRATVGYNVRVVLDSSKPADENNVIEVPSEWWNKEVE